MISDARSEWARGWPVVLAGSFGVMLSALFSNGLGTVMVPMQQELGWSRATITSGPMIDAALILLLGPLPGMLIDRIGPRRVALVSVPAYALATGAIGLAGPSLVSWYAVWIVMGLVAPFVSALIWTIGISRCFEANRGTAFALAMCGIGLAHLVSPLIAVTVAGQAGWRWVFPALGLTGFVLAYPLVVWLFHPDAAAAGEDGVAPDLPGMETGEIFRSWRFWVLALAVLLQYGALGTLFVHLQPIYLHSGISATAAARYASLMGAALMVGRLIGGWLVDRLPARYVAAVVSLLPVAAAILLLTFTGVGWVALFAPLCIGLAMGSEGDIIAYIAARYFGPRRYGSAFGVYMALYGFGFAFAPVIGGAVYDALGSYDDVLGTIAVTLVISAGLLGSIGRPPDFRAARHG